MSDDPWEFRVDEVSAGHYSAEARHSAGPKIVIEGSEPEELMEQLRNEAQRMDFKLEERSRIKN